MKNQKELDLLKVVRILIGELLESQPQSAIWRLAVLAEEIEGKRVLVKRTTEERMNRQDEMFKKLKQVIIYPQAPNSPMRAIKFYPKLTPEQIQQMALRVEYEAFPEQTSDLGRSPAASPTVVGQKSIDFMQCHSFD